MRKRTLLFTNLIICLILVLGSLFIVLVNQKSFKTVVEDDIENISKLSASKIYSEIENNLTRPIFVGQTMANDLFLKNWLESENATGDDAAHEALIQNYLSGYRQKYGYDSVFLVSAKSNTYYYYEGVNKTVSRENAHDIWYYNFVDSNLIYDLDVDKDEVNENTLTIFINCRVQANDGSLLGVVGVGVKMSNLQELLKSYESDYDLKAMLIDDSGVVQADSDERNIETVNFFDNSECLALKDKIINNINNMEMHWYPDNTTENCLITRYIPTLDWYIVVEKTTAQMRDMLTAQFRQDVVLIIAITALILLIVTFIISKYNRLLVKTATTDEVTNLPNAKLFNQIYAQNAKRDTFFEGTMFMFDIDHFKHINDNFGHLFGNTVLYHISELACDAIGKRGFVSRWGGDEFVGVIYAQPFEADAILRSFVEALASAPLEKMQGITISIGATRITHGTNPTAFIKEADFAMYQSKKSGRNRITYYEK